MTIILNSCNQPKKEDSSSKPVEFKFLLEQFADLKIMRYQVPGFESLDLKQKELIYYLSQAAISGRDIIFDQNGRYNLAIRRTMENIYSTYSGDKSSEEWKNFVVYLKRIWFSNGIYHHYGSEKFLPSFSQDYFMELVKNTDQSKFPVRPGQSVDQLIAELIPFIFDPNVLPKKVNLETGTDLVKTSAVNFYDGLSEEEVEGFYKGMAQPNPQEPLSFGINSKLVKENGKLMEKVWKIGGMYSSAIEKIVFWLNKATEVAENEQQKQWLEELISYYQTGDLKTWDKYNVLWVSDHISNVDVVNGFIENYEDPLGRKATWESVVDFKDIEATKRAETISANAQWFEDHSPVDPGFRKKQVKGVSAKVITVAQLGGDCYPSTPIGINLPNADWIRKEHGSKSVTMENITYAYDQAALGNGMLEEFAFTAEEQELAKKYGSLASNVHTDLHECLGHGSGQLLPGTSSEALKNYQSTLEEARADLFALYFIMDPKMVQLGVIPSEGSAKAEYNAYIRNGLITQLCRIERGKNIEEAHMRNRQLIAKWCFEHGKESNVIEFVKKENKTFIRINDYNKLRELFGKLLAEIQRIKSEGDFHAGQKLVEDYGVRVDQQLHKEVLERFKKLNVAPYGGFINPTFTLIENDGKVKEVKIDYPIDYATQMMEYSTNYSFLPTWN
ncbi:MAG: dihydrofolate reductase [Bacteroidetes bacterium]|nr:dihydrofolate reductase [Bacteroidota bacterium]